jgi:hypothetical protein
VGPSSPEGAQLTLRVGGLISCALLCLGLFLVVDVVFNITGYLDNQDINDKQQT